MVSDFIYLYGFVPADASAPVKLKGIAGSSVELLDVAEVKAAISRVPAEEYDPRLIDAQLQDLSWVGEQGVAHEMIVAWFVDHAEILPAALFTMYSSVEALREATAARARQLSAELTRFRNKREWDVKISFNEKEVAQRAGELSPRIAEIDQEIAAATPGKRYLLEKRKTDVLKTEARHAAVTLAERTLEAARTHAVDVRTLSLPRNADELPVLLHAALLVEREQEDKLTTTLERESRRLKDLGITVRFSGPWAPYRFMQTSEQNERTAAE